MDVCAAGQLSLRDGLRLHPQVHPKPGTVAKEIVDALLFTYDSIVFILCM